MQKKINLKAKIRLESSIIIQNLHIYYFKSYHLFYIIFSKFKIKDSIFKNLKLKNLSPKT